MSEFGCNLIIDTDSDIPNIVSEISGVPFTEILIKGKPHINSKGIEISKKLNSSNLWIYKVNRMQEKEGIYINHPLEDLFNLLNKNRFEFEKIFARYARKHVICYGYYRDFHQYFILKKDFIKLIASFDIDIEFDVYFLDKE